MCRAQAVIHRMTPVSGPPGTTVTLAGESFGVVSQAQLNGMAAAVTRMTSTEVQFTVPAGARPGFVTLQTSGASLMNPMAFTVTRPIQGRFNPPGGLARAGYRAIADGEVIPVNPATGDFTGAVPIEQVAMIWVWRSAADPSFLALVPPEVNQPIIDAASTAEALILVNPLVNGRSVARYPGLSADLRALGEFTELTSWIATVAGAGRDHLDDARVDDAVVRCMQSLLAPQFSAASAGQSFEP